jgi:single-strand selective monofunctional uracil DNA glycosylase
MSTEHQLIEAAKALSAATGKLRFAPPVAHVYNPLDYAWNAHEQYLRRFGGAGKEVVFLGINPGPFGMAQTGIPFGEVSAVRDWMKIDAPIGRPPREHPRRPVRGLACPRSEVSGRRLWGLFAQRFGPPENFFARHFVANWCPLAFMGAHGENQTPDKLPARESEPLFQICDAHLRAVLEILQPKWIIGIGAFAENRAQNAARTLADAASNGAQRAINTTRFADSLAPRSGEKDRERGSLAPMLAPKCEPSSLRPDRLNIGRIPHPSPANPAANRDWPGQAAAQLQTLGVWK